MYHKIKDVVSVIMPNYNRSIYIESAIQSVINQTYNNWELIVVDDKSTDNSLQVIEKFTEDSRVIVIKQDINKGVIAARNIGIEVAKGRYIAFLDSDDQWEVTKLEKQITFMLEKDIGFSYTAYTMMNYDGKILNNHNVPSQITYNDLLITCDIGCSTVIYDTSKIGKQLFEVNSIQSREDYILWLKIAKLYPNIMFGINEYLMLYRKHDGGISSNKLSMLLKIWKVYRIYAKLNLLVSSYFILRYSYFGLFKHYFKRS